MRHNDVYGIANENVDHEKKKLNRNVYNTLRSFLWNTVLAY